ncbi:fibronectin type III domain-containing protein [Fervidobacterium islandicum]|uniref:Fibronectin type III domain-containing protein n=1 Tax=Fervidobacterium islandicum TaxID=2423 RepID=A0AAI8CKL6_FERIS|nr:fibronectin type III domain-containing protein [Fervidobacterium islandicum]AMW31960.1 fibronectin type III domain-containing protein [Fervidobacterium islandicum]
MFGKFKTSTLLLCSYVLILVFLSACVTPQKSGPELLEPKNNAQSVPFNNTTLLFGTPSDGEYEVIVKEADTNAEVFRQVVNGGQNISVVVPKGRLKPDTKYKWYVRRKGNDSGASSMWYFTTKKNSLPSVYGLKPDKTEGHPFGALALTWNANDPDDDTLTFVVRVFEVGKDAPVYETTSATNSAVVKDLKQLTNYRWTVEAIDPWGAKSGLSEATFKTKANEAPERIELINPRNGELNVKFNNLLLKWQGYDKDYEDLRYTVTLRTGSSSGQALLSNSTLTEFLVTGLNPDTVYTLSITAVDKYGETRTESFQFTTKVNTPPTKPELTNPANSARVNFVSAKQITFTWTNATDPDEDDVDYEFVLVSGSQIVHKRSAVLSNSYTIDVNSLLDVGKTYTWYVAAKDRHGGRTESDRFTFETYRNTPPSVPTSPYPANGARNLPNRIERFSWDCSDPDGDALKFELYIGESPDNLKLEASNLTTKTYSTSRLFDFGKTYYWKVVVSDGYNPPVEGPVWSFTITAEDRPPTAPVLSSPSNGANGISFNNITLRWRASTDKETAPDRLVYLVYFGKADNMELVATVTGKTDDEIFHTISSVAPATTYYWRVEVKDSFGNYAYSTTWSLKTKPNEAPNIPLNPNPADGSQVPVSGVPTTVTLSWDCSDPDGDSLTYEVYINTSDDFSSVTPYTTTNKSVVVQINTLGRYYWYVVAKDKHGGETKSKTWNFDVKGQ